MQRIPTLILVLSLLAGCSLRPQQQYTSHAPFPCEVTVVHPTATTTQHSYAATVKEQTQIPLSLSLGGNIVALPVAPNSPVKQGDLLLRVDDTSARQALAAAKASLQQAEDAIRRTTPLHEKGLVTDIQHVELQTKKEQALAYLRSAEQQVKLCELRAPMEGIVTYSDLHIGQHVTPATTLMTLLDVSGFAVEFHVPETEMATIRLSDNAQLSIPALGSGQFAARVSKRGMQANPLTHSYPVEASVINPPSTMLPGMIGTLQLSHSDEPIIIIPQQCVALLPEGAAVWVANQWDEAERRLVILGGYKAEGVQVISGLNDGDRLITAGYQKLYDHAPLAIQQTIAEQQTKE